MRNHLLMKIILLAISIAMPAIGNKPQLPAQNPPKDKPIGKHFGSGIITLQRTIPGQPKTPASPLLVIRDAEAYNKFLDRIPEKQISRTRPAPPNEDPMLGHPPVDFKKHTLLVLISPTMARTQFAFIRPGKKKTQVVPLIPRPNPSAHPIHIGTYTAHLIPAACQPIQLTDAKPR